MYRWLGIFSIFTIQHWQRALFFGGGAASIVTSSVHLWAGKGHLEIPPDSFLSTAAMGNRRFLSGEQTLRRLKKVIKVWQEISKEACRLHQCAREHRQHMVATRIQDTGLMVQPLLAWISISQADRCSGSIVLRWPCASDAAILITPDGQKMPRWERITHKGQH